MSCDEEDLTEISFFERPDPWAYLLYFLAIFVAVYVVLIVEKLRGKKNE